MEVVVVGSGPTGTAIAGRLIEKGYIPLILDGGVLSKRENSSTRVLTAPKTEAMKTWFGSDAALMQLGPQDSAMFSSRVSARIPEQFGMMSH